MNPSIPLYLVIGLSIVVGAFMAFQQNWILGTTLLMVLAGGGFVVASQRLEAREGQSQQDALAAQRLRAIGLIVIGLGTLFGALQLLT